MQLHNLCVCILIKDTWWLLWISKKSSFPRGTTQQLLDIYSKNNYRINLICILTELQTSKWGYSVKIEGDLLGIFPGGGGGTCTLIFSYIRRLGSFFWIQNFEFQYFFGVFRKINIFLVWIFCGYFLGSSQNWTIFRDHFHAFKGLFLRSMYTMGDFFLGFQDFKYFLGVLEIHDIF